MSTFLNDDDFMERITANRPLASKALQEGELINAAEMFTELKDYNRAARAFEKAGEFDKALNLYKVVNNKIDSMRLAILLELPEEEAFVHASSGNLEKAKLICKRSGKMTIYEDLLFNYGSFHDVLSYGARKSKLEKTIQIIKDRNLGGSEELKALGIHYLERRTYKRAFICCGAAQYWEGFGMAAKRLRRFEDAGLYFEKAGLHRQASISFEKVGMILKAFKNLARANPNSVHLLAKLRDFSERINDEEILNNELRWCLANDCWNSFKALSHCQEQPFFIAINYLQERNVQSLSNFFYRINSLSHLESIAQWAWTHDCASLFAQAFIKNHTVCFSSWAKGLFHKDVLTFFFQCIETYLRSEANDDELILFLLMVQKRDRKGFLVYWILEILEHRELFSEIVNMLEWAIGSTCFGFIHAKTKTQLARNTYKGPSLAWRLFLSKDDGALLNMLETLDNVALTKFFSSRFNRFEHLANLIYRKGYDENLVTYLKDVSPKVLGRQAALHSDYKTAGEAYLLAEEHQSALINAKKADDSYVELGALLSLQKRALIYEFLNKPKGSREAKNWLMRKPSNDLERRTRVSLRYYVKKIEARENHQ